MPIVYTEMYKKHIGTQYAATTMRNVERQQLIHLKVAVVALNVLFLECIKVVMQITVDNDKVDCIP